MNLIESVKEACTKPTLLDALTYVAIWESERAIKQAKENPQWETCFRFCFKEVMKNYKKEEKE